MRCPDCTKFVSMDTQDPELETIDIDETTIVATVRICRVCAECGTELKEATLEMEEEVSTVDLVGHYDEEKEEFLPGHTLSVTDAGVESVEETTGSKSRPTTMYGAEVSYEIFCSCQKDEQSKHPISTGTISDKIPASGMDELV